MADLDVGDKIKITGEFRTGTITGTLTDPTAVKLRYQKPGGSEVTLTYGSSPATSITKTATGKYEAYVTIDEYGPWYYRWIGTGAVVAQEEGTFDVKVPQVTTS
jgi:hypothetical protein